MTKANWLLDEAAALGLTPNALWRVMGIKQNNAREIVQGKRPVPRWVGGWLALAHYAHTNDPEWWAQFCEEQKSAND
jgi:plasmid maintenance system antidote protein VapI